MAFYFEFDHSYEGILYTFEAGVEGVAPSGLSKHKAESDLDFTGYSKIVEVYVHNGDECSEVEDLETFGLTEDMIWRYHGLYMDANEIDHDY